MLVVSRRPGEKIVFPGTNITVQVIAVKGKGVRLGIEAPPHVTVLRAEVRNGEGESSPEGMPKLPEAGQRVRWRNPEHARSLWWDETYGPGPFEVVGVVDKSGQGIPAAVVLKTDLGDREVNTVWLAAEDDPGASGGTAKVKAERVALLVKALGCDAGKAAQMAAKLSGLTDEAFRAHADYLAQQLAGYLKGSRTR